MNRAGLIAFVAAAGLHVAAFAVEPTPVASQQAADTFPHPVLPGKSAWPGRMMQGVAALFVLAAVIGPVLRRSAHGDLPPRSHSHDEPPGASGHHGKSGTVDVDAPDHSPR
jgi:hypothetical protein